MMSVTIHAQFINNGATVTIQSGATLRIETDFINNSGTVTNNGVLEVKEDFTNAAAATFTSAVGSTVKFIGDTPSTVTSNGDAFHHVSMEKTAENITLADAMSVAGTLTFTNDNNKVILGANNLTIQDGGSIASADDNEYVVADGAGSLIKGLSANGTYTHEIGDASNYTPLSSVVSGSTYAMSTATLGARVYTGSLQAKYTDATDYINREWQVVASGITDYTNTMTGTYVAGDATGTQSLIKGSTYHTADWHFDGSNNAALQVIASTTTSDVKLSGQNFFGRANLKAFLQGPYNATTGLMSTSLNSTTPSNNMLELHALTSPYPDASASVSAGFFLANPTIVDWVKLELRDPNAPSTPTTYKSSAFIKNNGEIVGLDGSSLPLIKNGYPTSVVVLSHRNHLSIRSVDAGLNVANPTSQHDFSASMSNCHNSTTSPYNSNTPMKFITGTVSTNALWAGDINQNDVVLYNGLNNDRGLILSLVGSSTPSLPYPLSGLTYNNADVNMNGIVLYNGLNNDRSIILNNVGSSTPSNPIRTHYNN